MAEYTLVIGNKNYSSWSMRPWLGLKLAGIRFQEQRINLGDPADVEHLRAESPNGRVPYLKTENGTVWESLAILDYAADQSPHAGVWPENPRSRALCRSACCEMHAGFESLRREMPMNIRSRVPNHNYSEETQKDIQRVFEIWDAAREQFQDIGPFLFGPPSAADCMFAPVATRFVTYEVPLNEVAADYVRTLHSWPPFQEWIAAARAESEVLPEYEFE